ncbi:MAG: hypothetical protein IKB12_08810, partial [Clostridia bacterium]|nr:hypothetical protein [Clostridia bacterium]
IIQEKSRDFTVEALKNEKVFTLYEKQLKTKYNLDEIGIKSELYENGELLSEKTYLFKPEKDLKLRAPQMNLSTAIEGDEIAITVKSDAFARLVRAESSLSTLPLSDNYFDLLPGESKTVTMKLDPKFTAEEQMNSFSLMCANAIEPKSSELYDLKERARVFIRPENMGQWIYYGQKGKQ